MPGQVTLRTSGFLRQHYERLLKLLREEFGKQNTMNTELFTDTVIEFNIPTHASRTIYNLFVARRDWTVVGIDVVPNVAQGGALTATFVKAIGTATPAAGTTPLHSGTANLNGTAHTVQQLTLTTTGADLVLANGNRIAVVLSGALSAGEAHVTIRLRKS